MLPKSFKSSVVATAESILDIPLPDSAELQGTGRMISVPLPGNFDITSEINSILPSGTVKPPSATKMVKPVYPEEARVAGIEGKVILKVTILFDGTIGEIKILQSSGRDDFDQAAKECVKHWKFEPAMQSGIRVTMPGVTIPITFEITND